MTYDDMLAISRDFAIDIAATNLFELLEISERINRVIATRANDMMVELHDDESDNTYEYWVQVYKDANKASDEAARLSLMATDDLL